MNDFVKILGETKAQLKSLITKESSQETIKAITDIDSKLDSLNAAFTEKTQENESLKDDLIASVKNTGFKVNNSSIDDTGIDQNPKSIEDILQEELNNTIAKQK